MAHRATALTLLVLLALAPAPGLAQEVIKIGFFAPLTGFAAADGARARHSAEIAVEELNAGGGIKGKKVELVVYDDRHDSKEAVASPTSSSTRIGRHLDAPRPRVPRKGIPSPAQTLPAKEA